MKPKLLEKLIKKTRKEIDDVRVEKVQLENTKDTLEANLDKLIKELKEEQKIAAKSVEARHTYESFYNTSQERQIRVREEIVITEEKILDAESRLFECFKTVKQYEILLNKYIEEQKIKLDKEESKMLDELGIIRKKFAV